MKVKEMIWNLEDDATDLDKLLSDIEGMESGPGREVALSMWKEAFEAWKETARGLRSFVEGVKDEPTSV